MRIDGVSDTGIRLNTNKNIRNDKEKRKKDIEKQNRISSEVDISDFREAKKITARITGDLGKKGTSILDSSKIDGNRIFDLLKEDD